MKFINLRPLDMLRTLDSHCIFIWNIPEQVKHRFYSFTKILTLLQKFFSKFGEIVEITLNESCAIIEFTEEESAVKAIEMKKFGCIFTGKNWEEAKIIFEPYQKIILDKLNGEYFMLNPLTTHNLLLKDWELIISLRKRDSVTVRLDYLNDDCLFKIYSYLYIDDIDNLSEVSERQYKVCRDYEKFRFRLNSEKEVSDLPGSLTVFPEKLFSAFGNLVHVHELIYNNYSTKKYRKLFCFGLRLHEHDDEFFFLIQLTSDLQVIYLSLLNFAYLEVDHLYLIEDRCINLESLIINFNTQFTLQEFENVKKYILDISNSLKLKNSYSFFKSLFSSYAQQDVDLILIKFDQHVLDLKESGKIDSLRKLYHTINIFRGIMKLTNKLQNFVNYKGPSIEETYPALELNLVRNLKYLSESNLGKKLKILQIDLDFFNITEDYMEYFINFENLKELKLDCRPGIMESCEFLETMKQLIRYNKLEKLELNIKWMGRSDNSVRFVENFKSEAEEMMNISNRKKPLILKIRVFHQDRSNQSSFVLNRVSNRN